MTYEKEYAVYPGGYIPLRESAVLHEQLKQDTKGLPGTSPILMHDHPDHYRVDISMPGIQREELMVSIQNGVLTLEILPQLDKGPVEQKVIIPGYIENEFVTASFLLGMLYIFLPKAKDPPDNHQFPVVVY